MVSSPPKKHQFPNWNNLTLEPEPETNQLGKMTVQLQLILLAIEALTGVPLETILQVGTLLKLSSPVPEQTTVFEQSSVQHPLTVEQVRSLVLTICYIAQQDQALIRRALGLVEQMAQQNSDFRQVTLLREYLDTFNESYQQLFSTKPLTPANLDTLAVKLLIDLLFYSKPESHQSLWLALLQL